MITNMSQAGGIPLNPVTGHRIACSRKSGRSTLVVLRTILAASIGATLLVEYGFVDWLARRRLDDPLWFRPIDVIRFLVFVVFVLVFVVFILKVSFIVRKDDSTHIIHPYSILWNFRIGVIPFCAAVFILYDGDVRWRTSFEATLAFTAYCVELVAVAVPIFPLWT